MSENDRMERAKRIRRMREGQRDEDDDSSSEETAGPEANGHSSPAEETDSETPTADESVETTTQSTETATASTDGGAATAEPAEPDQSEDETADQSTDEVTPEVSEVDTAIGSEGGTTAELPSAEEMEAAMEQTMDQAEAVEDDTATEEAEESADETPAGPAAGIAGEAAEEATQEADTRVLEFTLDDEQYCLDIKYIEEIVKHTNITRVPNTPEFVEGVVDLRGQITTILNPKVTIDKPNKAAGDLIVVFDSEAFEDQGHIGWVVDDVRQVSPVRDDEINDPPMSEDYINGVIDRDEDEEFVIWTTPDLALEEAE